MPEAANVAVVTGGSRGIGTATAVLLAGQGLAVCVGYRQDAAAADQVVAACERAGAVAVAARAGALIDVSGGR
ncbi:MAG: SDR family NAD(P)-dependent oxidoreductase [Acidimicrobiales bacterium]